jgi:hypothetical protein
MDGQENDILPAVNFRPYNSTSLSSVMLSPTTLPAKVVAEVFSLPRPSRRSTSIAAGSAPDGSGRLYNCPETPILFCDSPFSRYCTGHCRTKGLYLQQLHLSDNADKADVVRFLNWFLFDIHLIMSHVRFVSRLLKIPNGLGIYRGPVPL